VIERLRPGALDEGDIVMQDGTVVGRHNGIINYTIGQRRGLGIAHENPLYVIKINPEQNQVVVGYKEDLYSHDLMAKEVNWLGGSIPEEGIECTARLRSVHKGLPARVYSENGNRIKVKLTEPYNGITPGQACVLYDGTRLLGGGWIERS
jgi:tRNA-specific 2-thiouridylase